MGHRHWRDSERLSWIVGRGWRVQRYLENIKVDGYATSHDYVANLMRVISDWDLTKYDKKEETQMGIKIEQRIATQSPCYKAGKTIVPKGGMLHSVGCPQPDPLVFVRTWSTSSNVCVHAVVGKEKVVYQVLPWNRRGWHTEQYDFSTK